MTAILIRGASLPDGTTTDLLLEDGRVAERGTGVSRAGAGEHRLALLEARLTQMRVQVDQSRECDEAVGVDLPSARAGQPDTALGDESVLDHQVRGGAIGQ